MTLNLKKLTPFVVAGGLILTSCNRTNAAINENNIDNDNKYSVEYSMDDSTYSINNDNWEEVFSNNIEGNLYEVSKNKKLTEDEAREYLHSLTGSNISFEACKDFYINRYETRDVSIGALDTTDTLYIDHNVVSRSNTHREYTYIEDGEETNIPVIDLSKQGKSFTAENLAGTGEETSIYTQVSNDSRVTINSTDFTTEYESVEHPDKDSFFDQLMLYPEFVDSFDSIEDMKYEISNYHDDSEYVVINRAVCGPDGELSKEYTHFFCDDELLFGYAGDYNLTIYLSDVDESVSLDDVKDINNYLDRTNSSQEDLITVHEDPGYTPNITGKYSSKSEKGHAKTY
jgi:hypothetical protein